jgi:hypothetical protein
MQYGCCLARYDIIKLQIIQLSALYTWRLQRPRLAVAITNLQTTKPREKASLIDVDFNFRKLIARLENFLPV